MKTKKTKKLCDSGSSKKGGKVFIFLCLTNLMSCKVLSEKKQPISLFVKNGIFPRPRLQVAKLMKNKLSGMYKILKLFYEQITKLRSNDTSLGAKYLCLAKGPILSNFTAPMPPQCSCNKYFFPLRRLHDPHSNAGYNTSPIGTTHWHLKVGQIEAKVCMLKPH